MPPATHAFGPEARLCSRPAFRRVFSEGRKLPGRNLILWFCPGSSSAGARLGLSVSVKCGIAVRRNRLKRLTREAFRFNRALLKPGSDLVVYLRPGCRWQGLRDAERDLMELCRKAGLVAS